MRLPHFPFRQKYEVFAAASELASLRLEQCIADLGMSSAPMRDVIRSGGIQPPIESTNLFQGPQ